MKKRLWGFTLIELMVVVMIIGILATCAIPAYQHYLVRARVTEGLTLATNAKLMVSETLLMHQKEEHVSIGEGFVSPPATENVSSIAIDADNGDITVSFSKLAGEGSIIFHPIISSTGQISWDCKNGTLASVYRPSVCK